MPILPAFFRHHFHPTTGSQSSKALSASWKKGLPSSNSASRNARLKASRDPYLLNRNYSELNELESGTNNTIVEIRGTIKMDDGHDPAPLPDHAVDGFYGDPNNRVIVSRSVQVESHPRGIKE